MSEIEIPIRVQVGEQGLVEVGTISHPHGLPELFRKMADDLEVLQEYREYPKRWVTGVDG
ncbi:hypothetical protein [Micromonospora sp. GCM10011541]|uniref:hypothetical protein n=1 Tax=Micromonospora sp. GCM10011541 TaxID=3317336 RepID=UPI00360A7E73